MIKNIADLTPDDRNANRGTERGSKAVERSLREYGAGRSILIDRNGKIIAGNKTVANAPAVGLEEVIVVPTDGTKLVAVQRTDLDMDSDPRARELAIADNRAGELGLEWDADVLTDLSGELDLSPFFTEQELKDITGAVPALDEMPTLASGEKEPFQQMSFVLHDSQVEQVKAAIEKSKGLGAFVDSPNENSNGNALTRICELFLNGNC